MQGGRPEEVKRGSDHERLAEALGSAGLCCKEVAAEGEDLRLFARAHGVPEGAEVGRALEIANGDVLFFDRLGRYVGMGSAYGTSPLF